MSLAMDDIRYFSVVSETLNFTRASEKLGITQPTLSYAIKRLENELGGELFIRLKNGVRHTELGEAFLDQAGKVLFEWEQAKKIAVDQKSTVSGTFSLGMHTSVALYSMEHFLPELTKKYPQLEFEFQHGLSREMTEQVVSWKLDFGLVVNPKPHPDLVIKEICKDRVTLFKKAKAKNKLIIDPNLIQVASIMKKIKKDQYDGFITSPDLEVIAKLTALGEGTGVLPTRVAAKFKNISPLSGAPDFHDKICLVYRVEKQKSLAAKKIIEVILNSKI